jgi:hypothetical protein
VTIGGAAKRLGAKSKPNSRREERIRVFYMETEALKVFLCAPFVFSAIKDFKVTSEDSP